MAPTGDAAASPTQCPVDHVTRERWLEAARAKQGTGTSEITPEGQAKDNLDASRSFHVPTYARTGASGTKHVDEAMQTESARTLQDNQHRSLQYSAGINPSKSKDVEANEITRKKLFHGTFASDPTPEATLNDESADVVRARRHKTLATATFPFARFSLDNFQWEIPSHFTSILRQQPSRTAALPADREVSTIPRARSEGSTRPLNSAEAAALPPANSEGDTGHDRETGNWVYPSQQMFFDAMRRKGHAAEANDMATIVPIHNAVNERAWTEIKGWERGYSDACGGPKLVSFAGDSKNLTPKARWNAWMGYEKPFDRHDWVVDRCGKEVEYVIDFYAGKKEGASKLNFYLDVRPKLNTWEGIKTRISRTFGT